MPKILSVVVMLLGVTFLAQAASGSSIALVRQLQSRVNAAASRLDWDKIHWAQWQHSTASRVQRSMFIHEDELDDAAVKQKLLVAVQEQFLTGNQADQVMQELLELRVSETDTSFREFFSTPSSGKTATTGVVGRRGQKGLSILMVGHTSSLDFSLQHGEPPRNILKHLCTSVLRRRTSSWALDSIAELQRLENFAFMAKYGVGLPPSFPFKHSLIQQVAVCSGGLLHGLEVVYRSGEKRSFGSLHECARVTMAPNEYLVQVNWVFYDGDDIGSGCISHAVTAMGLRISTGRWLNFVSTDVGERGRHITNIEASPTQQIASLRAVESDRECVRWFIGCWPGSCWKALKGVSAGITSR